jgi:hypothetical protein
VSLGFPPLRLDDIVDVKIAPGSPNALNNILASPVVRHDKQLSHDYNNFFLEPEQDFELFGPSTTMAFNDLTDPSPLLANDAGHAFGINSLIDFQEDAFGAEAFDLHTGTGSAVLSCDGAGNAAEPERPLVSL